MANLTRARLLAMQTFSPGLASLFMRKWGTGIAQLTLFATGLALVETATGVVVILSAWVWGLGTVLRHSRRAVNDSNTNRDGQKGLPSALDQEPTADDCLSYVRLADWKRARWLMSLGKTPAERRAALEALFSDGRGTITGTMCVRYSSSQMDYKFKKIDFFYFEVTRNLASMDIRTRECLRVVALLMNVALDGSYDHWMCALLYGEGKGSLGRWAGWQDEHAMYDGRIFKPLLKSWHQRNWSEVRLSLENTVSELMAYLDKVAADGSANPEIKAIAEEFHGRLGNGDGGWLKSGDLRSSLFGITGTTRLQIGAFPDGTPLEYGGEGSLVTIAPPGSGKTQCNVYPNLLRWDGPAVVLDISGDLYDNTSKWRAQNVGPVYKFSPLDPDQSHSYNPLTFVRSDEAFIWEDSRLLAETLIVPSPSSTDPFWETEARTVVTASIAQVCYANPPEKRPMHKVLDPLFGGEPWQDLLRGLRMAVDVRVMQQYANSLASMQEKTLASVLQTARSSMGAWTGPRLERITSRSDWSPLDLRTDQKPTVYIHVRPNEVESYLSVLRVFIGQHIRMLCSGKPTGSTARPILFMLDELPRLRYMAPVEEALEIGRNYNLRLWMFAQSVGQFQTAYKNADGMIGNCAVRVYMNPSGADGLAEKLSEEIGYRPALDGSRARLVEAAELAGPKFGDQQIVLARMTKPIKVGKRFAWQDPDLKARMGGLQA